jgi:hypothetical protein
MLPLGCGRARGPPTTVFFIWGIIFRRNYATTILLPTVLVCYLARWRGYTSRRFFGTTFVPLQRGHVTRITKSLCPKYTCKRCTWMTSPAPLYFGHSSNCCLPIKPPNIQRRFDNICERSCLFKAGLYYIYMLLYTLQLLTLLFRKTLS